MKLVRLLIVLALFVLAARVFALPETSAGAIHAVVTAATGELRIYGPQWSTGLVVSVKIDNNIYTNSAASPAIRFQPAVLGQLRDTIAILWNTPDSVDVNLRCYPYDQDLKIEISFSNVSATSHTCAAEVLQSYSLQGTTNPYLGTDRDYSNIAREIPGKTGGGAPQLFFLGVSDVVASPYNPGLTTGGRFAGKGLDLLGPQHLYFGVWSALAVSSFGPPNELPVGCDGGLLLVWNPLGVSQHETRTIAKWLMGRGVGVCSSSDIVLFSTAAPLRPFDSHIFDLMAVAYSVNQRGLTNARLVVNVDPPLRLVDRQNGTNQLDTASLGGDITKGSARATDWRIYSLDPPASSVTWTLGALGDNLEPLYRDGCDFAYDLPSDVIVNDRNGPVIVREAVSSGSDSQSCSNRYYRVTVADTGSGVAGYSISGTNFEVKPQPFIPGTDTAEFTVSVVDPLVDGQAEVTFLDRVRFGVKRTYTYCSVQDTAAPIVEVTWAQDSAIFTIREPRPWDRGIQDFTVTSIVNAAIDSSVLYQSIDSDYIVVKKLSTLSSASLCLSARDKAGNVSDVVCWSSPVNAVRADHSSETLRIDYDGNNRIATATEDVKRIEVYDVLGRLVLTSTTRSVDLSHLVVGTYIVRAVGCGVPVVKRIGVR